MVVQWLRLHDSFIAGGTGLIPGQGTKIPQVTEEQSPRATAKDLI